MAIVSGTTASVPCHVLNWHIKTLQVGKGRAKKTIIQDIGKSLQLIQQLSIGTTLTRIFRLTVGEAKTGDFVALLGPSGEARCGKHSQYGSTRALHIYLICIIVAYDLQYYL